MFPAQMKYSGSHYNRKNIEQDSGIIPKDSCDIAKHDLAHEVVGADVEHIDIAERVECQIEQGCGQAAGKKKAGASGKALPRIVRASAKAGIEPDDDKKDMPCERMDGKRTVAVIHACSVKEGKDAAKQPEIHKECKQYAMYPG